MHQYDIVVLGSGIAGSIVALVLRQAGMKVLVVERKTHPRFVIGESTLPTTSLLLHQLSIDYGVPELAQVAHYSSLREAGCAGWPKQHFWYGKHHEGRALEKRHEHLFEGLLLPMGPDVHMLRADADAFLASQLEKYGIEYVENTEMVDFVKAPEGVRVALRGPAGDYEARANLVVDATGHASFLAKRFGLRDEEARLHTNTRSIFGHFTQIGELDDALGGPNPGFRFVRSAGTMHHCFTGGWIWVIPFDNGVTSVGIQLDRRIYPLDESISAEDEFTSIVDRYPSVKAHLGRRVPVRPLIRADRIQFTCSSILGDGFVLTPHAASFIEPLFSTGILLTLAFVSRFAPVARAAHADGDWDTDRFRSIEKLFFAEVDHIDRIVDGMIQSFRDYDVFKQYWRNWVMGTFAQWCTSCLAGGATRDVPMLYGSALPGFVFELQEAHALVTDTTLSSKETAARLQARADVWWERICGGVIGAHGGLAVGAADTLCVRGAGDPGRLMQRVRRFADELSPIESTIDFANAEAWGRRHDETLAAQKARYLEGVGSGSDFSQAYDRILENATPATFDYRASVGLPARSSE